jgi:hypothetical protein
VLSDSSEPICREPDPSGKVIVARTRANPKPVSPFLGRWQMVSMSAWDEDYLNEEVQAFREYLKQLGGNPAS